MSYPHLDVMKAKARERVTGCFGHKPRGAERKLADSDILAFCLGYETALIEAKLIDSYSPFTALVVGSRGIDALSL
jgi:hypothetical protein